MRRPKANGGEARWSRRKRFMATFERSSAKANPKPSASPAQRSSTEAPGNPLALAPPLVHQVLQSPGEPPGGETRALLETRFGHDFGRVRIHADARAAESA